MTTSCPENNDGARNPMPVIGMYIAAASSVCFILILCDVIHGIHHLKRWLPCRFFSLNSVTLTLLSLCTKIPVDLTTPVPELSKFTGIALLCVCMGFMLPSIGSSRDSECFTNMVALSILVITVVVDICIQMYTHLIGYYYWIYVPYLIIMVFMVCMVLTLLWFSTWSIKEHKEIHMDHKSRLLKRGSASMLHQLKLCYLHGYASDPQFALSKSFFALCSSLICLICSVLTFLVIVSGDEVYLVMSDTNSCYDWSMKYIVWTQILVIFLAGPATFFRWFAVSNIMDNLPKASLVSEIVTNFPYLKGDATDYLTFIFRLLMHLVLVVIGFIIILLGIIVITFKLFCFECFDRKQTSLEGSEEGEYLSNNGVVLLDWALRKCIKDMKKMDSGETRNSLTQTRDLLSSKPPSQESLDFKGEASSLDLVFLVRIISVSAPYIPSGHLAKSLNEIFDIIQFVDNTMNYLGSKSKRKNKLAKAMWLGKDFSTVLPKHVERSRNESQSDVEAAMDAILKLKKKLFNFEIWEELDYIVNCITGREYRTIEELHNYMEQLFVDMLHMFLSQLPLAMFKQLNESHVEEYEQRARRTLKLLYKVQSLESVVQGSFPEQSDITSLMVKISSVNLQSDVEMGDNSSGGDLNMGTVLQSDAEMGDNSSGGDLNVGTVLQSDAEMGDNSSGGDLNVGTVVQSDAEMGDNSSGGDLNVGTANRDEIIQVE